MAPSCSDTAPAPPCALFPTNSQFLNSACARSEWGGRVDGRQPASAFTCCGGSHGCAPKARMHSRRDIIHSAYLQLAVVEKGAAQAARRAAREPNVLKGDEEGGEEGGVVGVDDAACGAASGHGRGAA